MKRILLVLVLLSVMVIPLLPHFSAPVMADSSANVSVSANASDGHWRSNLVGYDNNSSDLYVGTGSGYTWRTFMLMGNITGLGSGDTVNEAHLELYTKAGYSSKSVNITIQAEKIETPVAVSNAANGEAKTLTTASVVWQTTTTPGWMQTTDIKTVIQELCDAEYDPGSIQFIIKDNLSAQPGYFYAYEQGDHSYAPRLYVSWTDGGSTPTVNNSGSSSVTGGYAAVSGNVTGSSVNGTIEVNYGTSDGSDNYTAWDSHKTIATNQGDGTFSGFINGLTAETLYYFNFSANYSGTQTFSSTANLTTTAVSLPTGTTSDPINWGSTWFEPLGTLVDAGGENCTIGFQYGLLSGGIYTANVTTSANATVGAFSDNISGLTAGTGYIFRAFFENSAGIAYSENGTYLVVPDTPSNFSATDGTNNNSVNLTWSDTSTENGFYLYRDDGLIASLSANVTHYEDTGAYAAVIVPGVFSASDGTSTSNVSLSIAGSTITTAATHTYKLSAYNDAGSSDNASDTGYRGHGTLSYTYQVSLADSDANYSNIDVATSATSYNYTLAPAPTITVGTGAASDGTSTSYVQLVMSGQTANNGAGRYYRALLNADGCTQATATANRGYRGVGTLTYQWQRSSADADADYSNIDGGTTATYNDTAAPEDGSGRYYKCVLAATGATGQTTTADRGYRATESTSTTSTATPFAPLMPLIGLVIGIVVLFKTWDNLSGIEGVVIAGMILLIVLYLLATINTSF